ncbi:hypothetical protein ABMA58_17270 [Oceanospirillum sp. HFRX-1_2]
MAEVFNQSEARDGAAKAVQNRMFCSFLMETQSVAGKTATARQTKNSDLMVQPMQAAIHRKG